MSPLRFLRAAVVAAVFVSIPAHAQSQEALARAHEEAQQASMDKVAKKYPEAAREGAPMNIRMKREIAKIEAADPRFFTNPNWPEILADRIAAEIRGDVPPAPNAQPPPQATTYDQISPRYLTVTADYAIQDETGRPVASFRRGENVTAVGTSGLNYIVQKDGTLFAVPCDNVSQIHRAFAGGLEALYVQTARHIRESGQVPTNERVEAKMDELKKEDLLDSIDEIKEALGLPLSQRR